MEPTRSGAFIPIGFLWSGGLLTQGKDRPERVGAIPLPAPESEIALEIGVNSRLRHHEPLEGSRVTWQSRNGDGFFGSPRALCAVSMGVSELQTGVRSDLLDDIELPELIARVLGSARQARGASECGDWIEDRNLGHVSGLGEWELECRGALTREQALRLAAAFALGRRVERARFPKRPSLRTPERVFRYMTPQFRGQTRESFHALHLDSKHRLRRSRCVSTGTLTTSLVHPREVFGPALSDSAAALIVAHNHPSGDPSPSQEDLEITRRLVDAGKLLGVPLLDHVIVGEGRFVSLRERMDFSR